MATQGSILLTRYNEVYNEVTSALQKLIRDNGTYVCVDENDCVDLDKSDYCAQSITAIYFDSQGHIMVDYVEEGETYVEYTWDIKTDVLCHLLNGIEIGLYKPSQD